MVVHWQRLPYAHSNCNSTGERLRIELEEAAPALRDLDDRPERSGAASDLGRDARQGQRRGSEVLGSALGGATPASPDPPGRHGVSLSLGVRRAVEEQPRRDRSVPCGQEVQRGGRYAAKEIDPRVQSEAEQGRTEGISLADVGVPP